MKSPQIPHWRISKTFIALLLISGIVSCSVSKKTTKKGGPARPANHVPAKTDSTSSKRLLTFIELIGSKAKTQKGLFTIHQVGDKYYFNLPDSLMGRDILVVTRFFKNTAGVDRYAGEELNEQTIRWEKGPSNKLLLRIVTLISAADTTNNIYKAVEASSLSPIIAAFDIKAKNRDSSGVVIEVTDFLKSDNPLMALDFKQKKAYGITTLSAERSYISKVHTFPINTEIRTVKTYLANPVPEGKQIPAALVAGAITVELNSSFILLPKTPMKKRLYDPRVGYFADDYQIFSDDQQRVKNEIFIHRWKLEPKPADREKWEKGELVEPAKPIVYYIDPATPKKWQPYLIAGINDWQKAFEKAGFKNAIIGKEWPEHDTTMSLEDARNSVIRYLASPIANAYGPNVADPRSGEIIESHIGWYHNVMSLVHNWYMIQAGAIDPQARKMVFSDSLMGPLIRFVSSHEVGHTLGLRHNMGSSSLTPVEKLRDKAWVEAHGHTASIMDYARFNYVAQPEDSISEAGIFPRIGDYDLWAIKWGYGPIPGVKTPLEEAKILNKMVIDSLKNPRLWFGGEGHGNDPRSQTEDLGDNSMIASEYGIKNLKRELNQLPTWTYEENDKYANLSEMYNTLLDQFNRYMFHVLKNIGGVYYTSKSVEQSGNVYAPVSKARQKEALTFLDKQLFQTPQWLLNKDILNKISSPENSESLENIQQNVLTNLLSASRLARMANSSNRFDATETYKPEEFIGDVKSIIWSELKTKRPISFLRRDLQKRYVTALTGLLGVQPAQTKTDNPLSIISASVIKNTDIPSIARANLVELKHEISAAIPATNDKISKYHLQDVLENINNALNPNK